MPTSGWQLAGTHDDVGSDDVRSCEIALTPMEPICFLVLIPPFPLSLHFHLNTETKDGSLRSLGARNWCNHRPEKFVVVAAEEIFSVHFAACDRANTWASFAARDREAKRRRPPPRSVVGRCTAQLRSSGLGKCFRHPRGSLLRACTDVKNRDSGGRAPSHAVLV